MIPIILCMVLILSGGATAFADSPQSAPAPANAPAAPEVPKAPSATATAAATACLRSGDGYFRARVAGAVEATIDWPNSGTRCEGEPRDNPPGVRLSFQRASGGFGTLGDSRCTVDSLTQRALEAPGSYRLEARGFCTQPAHAVRGNGAVLVSTFEFAGLVTYDTRKN